MPKRTVEKNKNIEEKLKYLGLDLQEIPKKLKQSKPLEFRAPKFYEEKQYKQYRYVSIKDIQIMLSPTNRLDDIEEKYKKSSPLEDYLDSSKEENIIKYTTFLNMLKQLNVEDIEKIEEEQKSLNKKIPFKVKYENNYLWQIYYSENTDMYFMLVPTEDSDYSTFFYLLKKKIEKNRAEKIFVPIRNVDYSNNFFIKSQFEDIENYLWLFTKDWPLIYEVYDKNNNLKIEIIGETNIYQKIKSYYKKTLNTKEEATKFYKLLKAMFILQTELPHYFNFITKIDKTGQIEFYLEDEKIEYDDIAIWLKDEYEIGEDKLNVAEELLSENKNKLKKLKIEISNQEIEYLAKEKQISTFLECKKTFFGKFKYYFKYSKKNNKSKLKDKQDVFVNKEVKGDEKLEEISEKKRKKKNYNIEEIVELYRAIEEREKELKNLVMDINALKLKSKNMKKKIENATAFIQEIDNHKKSIFEFWKYSNKDEMASLPEGEAEEVNVIKKVTKTFDYEQDLDNLGKTMDKMQRKILNKDETDSLYITTATDILELINKIKINEFSLKDVENVLAKLKKEAIMEKTLSDDDDFDIFGGMLQEGTKVSRINNKKHRELPKDKFNILEITKNTKKISFKLALERIISNVKEVLTKVVIPEDIFLYKAIPDEKIDDRQINVFDINPESEIKEKLVYKSNKLNFYKLNIKEGTNGIAYTNCIFYDNQNKTLPVGQDLSTKMLVDISKLDMKFKNKTTFRIIQFEEDNDFSKATIKTVNVFEYDTKMKKQKENRI